MLEDGKSEAMEGTAEEGQMQVEWNLVDSVTSSLPFRVQNVLDNLDVRLESNPSNAAIFLCQAQYYYSGAMIETALSRLDQPWMSALQEEQALPWDLLCQALLPDGVTTTPEEIAALQEQYGPEPSLGAAIADCLNQSPYALGA